MASTLGLVLVTLMLSACGTTGTLSTSGEARAERHARNGDFAAAASAYIRLAEAELGAEKDRLTLLAVEQWLDAGDMTRARDAFSTVARPAGGNSRWLWDSNRATFHLYAGEAEDALELLEALNRQTLSPRRRLRVGILRADAWIQKGDPSRAVELMTNLETRLGDHRSIEQNRWRLWQGLIRSNSQALREGADEALDPNVRGWLSLASLAANTGQQGIGWTNGAMRWRDANPGHAAMSIISNLQLPDEVVLDYPRNVALLLPLSGRTAAAGQAIQNGFMGAYFSTASGLDEQQTVRVYDVSAEGGASAAYASAVQDGAEFVIGPLLRNSVLELANDTLVPVPVLTLNYLPDDSIAPPGLYQFALAPEDEARSAALRAYTDGHNRAVALVPNNDWGRRVLSSFTQEFEALGGTLLDYRNYTPGLQDFSDTIEDLMALSGSVQRYKRLRANIGTALQFDPRRRQDTDFIFLAADAPAGRLLKSQLKFHYSGDLPVYSTSSIFSMDGRSNADLNGIMFADTPWIIAPQAWIRHLPSLYNESWPEHRRLGRLHAMGFDAYQLISSLHAAQSSVMTEIEGATGRLYLDPVGRVRRKLAWAQFQRGEPVAMPETDATGGPIRDISEDAEMQSPNVADDEPWPGEAREL